MCDSESRGANLSSLAPGANLNYRPSPGPDGELLARPELQANYRPLAGPGTGTRALGPFEAQ